MGDGFKLRSKDNRHRSSSSLSGLVERTRSDRRLHIRASIPEVDDQFLIAEERCEELQQKIDLVKSLKRKKKLKKRSMSRINESPRAKVPLISVTTQPKENKSPQQRPRVRRLEEQAGSGRWIVTEDPDQSPGYVEQQRQLRGTPKEGRRKHSRTYIKSPGNRSGHVECGDVPQASGSRNCPNADSCDVYCGHHYDDDEEPQSSSAGLQKTPRRKSARVTETTPKRAKATDENPVVELYNNSRSPNLQGVTHDTYTHDLSKQDEENSDEETELGNLEASVGVSKPEPRRRFRSKLSAHRYEQPTVASQMKQTPMRTRSSHNVCSNNIPFVVGRSPGPSHNIGMNIQQVLNGVKMQQPLSGIPSTMAHHMGLRRMPYHTSSSPPIWKQSREFNALNLGRRTLRLPSYNVSYRRLLSMYRQGDGLVSRFLRAINRPHYFYTSMYENTRRSRGGSEAATPTPSGETGETSSPEN